MKYMGFHYLNNKWVSEGDLKISVFDLSVVRGFGCFDFLRTYHNKPFLLDDHIDRFFRSAGLLGLKIPKTKQEIKKTVYQGIEKNNFEETNIKIILTGGVSADSITPGVSSFIMTFSKAMSCPRVQYEKGVKLITIPASRALTEAKSLNYLLAVVNMQKAKEEKAEEALHVDKDGKIYEATRSNFFSVIRGGLVTPKEEILLGITRKVVVRLAKELGISVVERDLYMRELKDFQEAFITASNKEVMPVVKIDDMIIANGKVGPLTKRLMEEYKNLIQTS